MAWSAAKQIRKRREVKGISQDAVAARLGVSKSYLSHVETGKRSLTADQALVLSEVLDLPMDMLLTGTGKLPPDVATAVRDDAAAVTAAVRTQVEQSPVRYANRPEVPPVPRQERLVVRSGAGIPATIEVTKATSSYRAHSYHTKVPPAAIVPFIEAFTEPGGVVLDTFCGSGMTGVAARGLGRDALLSDLSPAAVHIARNYNTYCDPIALQKAVDRVAADVRSTMSWLYKPVGQDGQLVEYTTWSDIFECRACSGQILYWDVREQGNLSRCPHCDTALSKSELKWLGEQPVQSHVSKVGERMQSHAPTDAELALIDEVAEAPIPYWTPASPFASDREMWRASHGAMGIASASDFYSKRNLFGLASIRHAIAGEPDGRVREALMFAFTACVNRASKRYQWNQKRPTNVMSGTLYISSLRYEWNVWSLFRRKAADVMRYYQSYDLSGGRAQVYERSAVDQSCLATGSVDMAFIDPPFGSNIFYADSSFLWDAWLGSVTDQSQEIVVNQRRLSLPGAKDISGYGAMLTESLAEVGRVLRPGGHAVIAFSNSNDKVWEALQDAISDSGFQVCSAHLLDKGQPSIKGVKGQQGKEFVTRLDLAINVQRRSKKAKLPKARATASHVEQAVRAAVHQGEVRSDHVYASVLRSALEADLVISGITMPEVERVRSLVSSEGLQS